MLGADRTSPVVSVTIAGWLGIQPPLNVFNPPPAVALVYLSWGSDVTPQIALTIFMCHKKY